MTPEEERRWVLRGHYALEGLREVQAVPEPEPEREQEPGQEQPVKASFPKGKQAAGG